MLKIVKYGEDEYAFPALVALGCFDGLHKGHAELLKKAKLQAKINGLDFGVMMFVDGKGGRQLFTFEERLEFLREYNAKFVLAIEYTEEFKKTTATEFLQRVEEKINVKAYMSGKDFRFGAGAKGKASTLKNYAENEENGVWYMSVKDVVCEEGKISATLIKEFLSSGNVRVANELLGRNYFVTGTVTTGAERGASLLGFPTMNLKYPPEKTEVKQGVYRVKCTVKEKVFDGIANYGSRPTFDEEDPVLEVYLKDFDDNAYGEQVSVEFVDYIRDIRKFDDADELVAQLKRDLSTLDGVTEESTSEEERTICESTVLAEDNRSHALESEPVRLSPSDEVNPEGGVPEITVVENFAESDVVADRGEEALEEQPLENVVFEQEESEEAADSGYVNFSEEEEPVTLSETDEEIGATEEDD